MGGTICVCKRNADQVTRSLILLPYFIVNKMLSSIANAEAKLGTPPNILEVFVEIRKNHKGLPINNCYEGAAVIASLLREDWIYTNKIASHVSLTRHEGYFTFSELFRQKFG
jgi:hypothetical protein